MKKIKLFLQKFIESFTACGLVMVQGDLSVFELKHFYMAGEVGLLTGLAFVVVAYMNKLENDLLPIYLTGVFVAIADYLTHPSMIGGQLVEPIITGTAAMLIAFTYRKIWP